MLAAEGFFFYEGFLQKLIFNFQYSMGITPLRFLHRKLSIENWLLKIISCFENTYGGHPVMHPASGVQPSA